METNNLLESVCEENEELVDRLDATLCNRFPDPAEIAWEQEDQELTTEEQEEVTEGLKGLGYL